MGGGGEFNKFPLSLRGAFNNTINPGGTRAIWKLQNICSSFWEFSHHLMGFN